MVGMSFCALTVLYVAGAVRLLHVMRLDDQLDHVERTSPGGSHNQAHGITKEPLSLFLFLFFLPGQTADGSCLHDHP